MIDPKKLAEIEAHAKEAVAEAYFPALSDIAAAEVPGLIAEVRRLRAALAGIEQFYAREGESAGEAWERVAEAFYRATGYLRPGKSEPIAMGGSLERDNEREAAWAAWVEGFRKAMREALR